MADPYGEVECPHDDCDQPISVEWEHSRLLYLGELDAQFYADALNPFHPEPPTPDEGLSTWRIGCLAGHVFLVPGPEGCPCDPDNPDRGTDGDPHDPEAYDWGEDFRTIRPHDMDRLRVVFGKIRGDT